VLPLQHPVHDVPSQTQTPAVQCCPLPHEPVSHTPPHPSSAPHALPAQLGVQPHTFAVPPPPHVSGALHALDAQHGSPLPPHAVQALAEHVCPPPHARHVAPPLPQLPTDVPSSHLVPLQQPAQDVASHTQAAFEQCCPLPHVPVVQVPPQPSSAPHALPVQLGVHPQTFDCPAPPHESGFAQLPPAQHGCPLPPHVPHDPVPHVCPPAHETHAAPPLPHCPSTLPGSHVSPLQHPSHDVPSQTQTPCEQRSPLAHGPVSHVPPHPSLAPHALPLHVGVQPH
jgi:hypothetical protein